MAKRKELPAPAHFEIDAATFWNEYRPIDDPVEGHPIREREAIGNIAFERLWTLVETGESDVLYALPGYHHINRLGYLVTEKAWPHLNGVAVYSSGVRQSKGVAT